MTATADEVAEPSEPQAPCAGDEDCAAKGRAHQEADEADEAHAMFEVGCAAEGVRSCEGLASAVSKSDPELARTTWGKACELGSADACAAGATAAYVAGEFEAARTMAEAICTDAATDGCGILGVLYAKGEGVSQDVGRARGYLQRACDAKDQEACNNLKAVDAAVERARVADVLPVEGANVSIGSIGVDGLQATNLQCRREGGGGLFGGAMGAISGIAKRKKRLMACGAAPEDVRVRWTTSGGRIKSVDVEASSKKVNACVKKALKGASAAFGGTCAATFRIGE